MVGADQQHILETNRFLQLQLTGAGLILHVSMPEDASKVITEKFRTPARETSRSLAYGSCRRWLLRQLGA